ncbi:MAG: type I restriction enzyme HsdR N-terminal domain-containing protein [Thermodesulfobacteriota bacterium]
MNSHHLILGTMKDFLTGSDIEDNHDERYRQKIARILINEKGYKKSEIKKNLTIELPDKDKKFYISVDYTIYIDKKPLMIVKYGPGSIITREKPAIACARLINEFEVPLCVVTNGEDAETIETATGKILSQGLDLIPSKHELAGIEPSEKISPEKASKAKMILFAFEVNDRCPCDDSICKPERDTPEKF